MARPLRHGILGYCDIFQGAGGRRCLASSAVYQWTEVVTTHMPHLSKPQAAVLALWSVGMVLARSCALTAVSLFLAKGLERKPNTVRQQLREWCYEAKAKRGGPRQEAGSGDVFCAVIGVGAEVVGRARSWR